MSDYYREMNQYYHNEIRKASYEYEDNLSKQTACLSAVSILKKARNGINFMFDKQIPYTISSSEKAFHFNAEYYDILKLKNNDYVDRINLIIRKIEDELEVIEREGRGLANKINDYRTKLGELRNSYGF